MARLNFNAAEVDPAQSFDAIPAGWQTAQITDSSMHPTKAGDGEYLKLEFTILGGDYDGRKVWTNLNLENPNPKAVEIAYQKLSAIAHAVGVLQVEDSSELHHKPLDIDISVRQATSEYAASNDIKGFRACAGMSKPGAASAPKAAAAPAKTAPPWAKK